MQQGPSCCANGVRGYGSTSSGVVFVGIAAGRDEFSSSKRPFTGPAGRLLNNTLRGLNLGFTRDDVYCTNICCQWNDKPEQSEIEVCWPRFQKEIWDLKPKLIVTLGDIPCQALLGRPLREVRGLPITDARWPCVVMPTYHPAAMFHEAGNERLPALYIRDMQKIPSYLYWNAHPAITWRVCRTQDEAQQVLNVYRDRAISDNTHLVSLDIETTNKPADEDESDYWKDRLVCVGLYDGTGPAYIIPADIAAEVSWHQSIRYLGHNIILFDKPALKNLIGIDINCVEDSQFESYSLNEQSGIHRLETLSAEYCGAGQYKDATRVYYRKGKRPPDELNYERCAADVVFTYELHGILKPKQIADDVRGVYENLIIPGANMGAELMMHGMAVDQTAMVELFADWIPRKKRIESRLNELARGAGWPADVTYNPASPLQTARILFDLMKYKPPKFTLTGAPSVDREVLDTFDIEFVDLLLDHRELSKALGTYIYGILDDVKSDRRIHPIPGYHTTRTGRGSYKNPPLQTIPQDKVKGHPIGLVRKMYVPDDPEEDILLESDYQQIEIWLGMALSDCRMMLQDLQENFHSRTAMNVLGARPDDLDWLDKRINAKKVTFGKMYREGIDKLSKKRVGIGCTKAEAAAFSAKWDNRYWEFIEWQHKIDEEVKTRGELRTAFGRKRRFPIVLDHRQLRQAVNFPIQSTASDYTLSSAIKLHTLLPEFDSRILLLVHDSILMNVKRRYLNEVMQLTREVMESRWVDDLPIVRVEQKVGKNWFEAHAATESDLELVN